MSEESVFWLGISGFATIAIVVMCIVGKGCNDSDNEMMKHMVDKGCLIKNYGNNKQYECGVVK